MITWEYADLGYVDLHAGCSIVYLTKLGLSKTAVTDQGIADAKKYLPFWIKIEREPS